MSFSSISRKRPRFQMIQVRNNWLSAGWHIGVLDNERKKVLELVTEDTVTAVIQEINMKDFGGHGKYIVIIPQRRVGDEDVIEQRWNQVLEEYDNRTKEIPYHPGGGKYGKNCEILAEYVMTGYENNRNGKIAEFVQDYLGYNIGDSRSF
jgi:hypothetical protein